MQFGSSLDSFPCFTRLNPCVAHCPRIRYLGFTTRGKKGPLTTMEDLSACKSIWTFIRWSTVNKFVILNVVLMILGQDFYANKAIKTFSWEKTSPFPTSPFCMKISRQVKETLVLCGRLDYMYFWEIFTSFEIANIMKQVEKICLRILWTWPAWHTCPGWYCNPQFLQPRFSVNPHSSPLPFQWSIFITKKFCEFLPKNS
jgi:hypothetical protein